MNKLLFLLLIIAISLALCYFLTMPQENKTGDIIELQPQRDNPLAKSDYGSLPIFVRTDADLMRDRELYGGFNALSGGGAWGAASFGGGAAPS